MESFIKDLLRKKNIVYDKCAMCSSGKKDNVIDLTYAIKGINDKCC